MAATATAGNGGKEAVFDLDAAAFSSDHFRMHEFKVKRCPRARPHDWTQCPFAHPGEKARRRDPRRYRYSGTACPEFRKSGCCRRGDACPFAHGVFECWLHPSRYRTQLCTDGTACKRRVCFFAHSEAELRRPEDDPVVAQRQVQAELAAEVQALQQQHLTQALSALLEANCQTDQTGGGAAGIAGGQLNLLTLELLRQTNAASNTPVMSSGDAIAPNANVQLSLLQQLAVLQQIQQQQQQQQQPQPQQQQQLGQQDQQAKQAQEAQQLLSGLSPSAIPPQSADPKKLQAVLASNSQSDFGTTLKNQLAEQLKMSNPTLEALNLLASSTAVQQGLQGDGQRPNAPCSTANGVSMPLSAAALPEQSVTRGFGSASVAADVASSINFPMDQNGTVQVGLLQDNADVMQSLAPGQLAALRARVVMAGQRRSIDNGVLARSAGGIATPFNVGGIGRQSAEIAPMGGEMPNGQGTGEGYGAAECAHGQVPGTRLDGNSLWSGLPNEMALKQAKVLLENLTLLQNGKNGSAVDEGLLQGANMEALLNASGLSAMSRVTSVDK